MDLLTDEAKFIFQVARCSFERIGVNCEGSTQNNERSAIFGCTDGLLNRETTNGLNRYLDSSDNLAQLIERAWALLSRRRETSTLIVTNMMNDEIAAEIL